MQRRMLSREDEAAVGKDELEVRREDQDKINKFSRLHQREMTLEEELKVKAKDREDLEELSNELELADEDDKIPYKVGDTFISLPLPEVQEMLASSTEKIEESVSAVEGKLSTIREEMEQLKVRLKEAVLPSKPAPPPVSIIFKDDSNLHGSPESLLREIPSVIYIKHPLEYCLREFQCTPPKSMDCLECTPGLKRAGHGTASSSDTYIEAESSKNVTSGQEKTTCDSIHLTHAQLSLPVGAESVNRSSEVEEEGTHGRPGNADKTIVSFADGDPECPYNWSNGKKVFVLLAGIIAVINSTLGSSLPSNAVNYFGPYFHVTNDQQLVLPITLFLVGYVFGPLFFGPLSETYGRRVIMLSSFIVFTLFTMACALSPNWPAFLVFRLICGVNASSAIAVVGGLYADVFADPVARGRAMAVFMAATTGGPQLAPVISGFVSVVSWRWTFWIGLIFAGVSLVPLIFLPETYGPTILKRRAKKMRKETGNTQIFAPMELEKKGAKQMVTVTLMRPLHMIAFEAIVLFTCLYLSLAYAIFYLFFEAYPLIFEGIYGMNTGESGLAFLPIIVGSFLALAIFIYYDSVLQRAKKANAHWASIEEYRRLPLACLGGPLYVISLFWLGWTASPHIHWIVPMLAGIPFGVGFVLIFMALLNYITDAYKTYAASGMAATSCCRSIFGAVLPLAGNPMYTTLGIAWASSLLGFLSLAMSVIPFAFIKYGDRIRANSRFCLELKQREEKLAREKKEPQGMELSKTLDDVEFGEKNER